MAKTDTNFQQKFSSFKDRIKSEQPEVPLQTVIPTKDLKPSRKVNIEKDPEVQFGVQFPKSVVKKLKLHSLEKEISMKEIILTAINEYFAK
jgi:hypothetical protein